MIKVEKTAKTLDEGIKNLMTGAKLDYERMSTSNGTKELTGYSKEQVELWDNKTKNTSILYNLNVLFTRSYRCFTIPIINLFF